VTSVADTQDFCKVLLDNNITITGSNSVVEEMEVDCLFTGLSSVLHFSNENQAILFDHIDDI
jgi:hypothetical protein